MAIQIGDIYDPWKVLELDTEEIQKRIAKGERHRIYWKCKCIYCGFEKSQRNDNLTRKDPRHCPKCRQGGMQLIPTDVGTIYNNCQIIADTGITRKHRGKILMLMDLATQQTFFRGHSRLQHGEGWHNDMITANHTLESELSQRGHEILDAGKIIHLQEYYAPTCQATDNTINRKVSLDDFVPQWYCFIEWQGEQHYKEAGPAREALERTQIRDQAKVNWCTENGWNLICVPWDAKGTLKITDLYPATSPYLVTPLFYCGKS